MSVIDPLPVPDPLPSRVPTAVLAPSPHTPSFVLGAANRSYKHQYASIYFVRLQLLRKFVLARARRRWRGLSGNPVFVPRVLDVEKGNLCYIIGTVYLDMPLKPNVLEDLARDHSLPAPAPRPKYHSEDDQVTLEDESGRIVLVGAPLRAAQLVTGVVLGVLGAETNGGEFEVIDVCYAGMAPQPDSDVSWEQSGATGAADAMDVDGAPRQIQIEGQETDEWIALVSGLEIGASSPADAQIQMMVEYLAGEAGGLYDQVTSARISRLIIAGNSLAPIVNTNTNEEERAERKARRYGHDTANFSPQPSLILSEYLHDIARAMPVHILPGASDPAGTLLPQQPFPRAMFRGASAFSSFSCETNPTYIHLGPSAFDALQETSPQNTKGKKASTSAFASGVPSASGSCTPSRTLLVSSGQPVDDMFKYLSSPPATRLSIATSTLRWRHLAPTAPDTLWCHPYFGADPFAIRETPDVYVVGNQPGFGTRVVTERGWGTDSDAVSDEVEEEGLEGEGRDKRCRVVLVPGFRETGILVLLNMRTLAVRTVQFAVEGMSAGGSET
ncbi:uncharacterized protein FIBRA_04993 [Fibroporia radiculosa]|uniref:DNA-directed DNA polymerase n=1 Tax=Fibroporia radiculosa TaxID=599839 RepID=J4H394_9APHY|nr:uncharacterized protein FIBRA_04993 [Fibroporia radiculosa]CCM02879.1 predicted protein [Fibroporia radiculosa]